MFAQWLAKPTLTTSGKIGNVITAFALNVAWIILIIQVLHLLMPYWVQPLGFQVPKQFPPLYDIFFGVIMAPLWEELAFRYAPYKVVQWFETLMFKIDYMLYLKKAKVKHTPKFALMIPIMVIATMLFGWGHGNGTISLLIQGVGGLLMSIIYIKNNYSYWSSVAFHAMWNTFCYFLI